jgi:uncharacterized protein GlcG (DUF336 family)
MSADAMRGARPRLTITIDAARTMIDAAFAKGEEKGIPFAVAIVDEGGNPVAFARQDGCVLAALTLCRKKAQAAVGFGSPTEGFWEFVKDDPALLVGVAGDPDLLVLAGGIPLKVDSAVVGAIGVSGAHYRDDNEVAQAAAAAFPS